MLVVLSPSKTQDFSGPRHDAFSQPELLNQSELLAASLKGMSASQISRLMKISDKLAETTHQNIQNFHTPFSPANARQALLAFHGDVYEGIDAENYTDADFDFAQGHLRILSGLYGLLRPLDLIQPYRLEMGAPFENSRGKNLYEFWGSRICEVLNRDLAEEDPPLLINLASQEYFKAVRPRELAGPVLTLSFREKKDGTYRVIGLFAKRARGQMTDFIIKKRITTPEGLKFFNQGGYRFRPGLSNDSEWVFCRD